MVTDREQLNQSTRAVIAKGMAYWNVTDEDLQQRLAIKSGTTYRKKMQDPSSFTLLELQTICKVLKLSPIDRCALIAPMSKSEVKDFLLV